MWTGVTDGFSLISDRISLGMEKNQQFESTWWRFPLHLDKLAT